ncbi:adenylate kinase, chloroplastic [Phalaenopsis equestris]|uniref:adenylate kinase, chloroplastic n=1 Tax=Phalaenopsis equestris TaxID=78828 RepID=UPI0009E4E012|nr:adenylate kinase, chloroplastic [Phalaenopsis equestris]
MASFCVFCSSVVAINPSRHPSTFCQSCMPNLSSTVGEAPDGLSSRSSMLRFACASSNRATLRSSFVFRSCGLNSAKLLISAAMKPDPLKIMISGAPGSGKGTQCELIKGKYNLVHIAAGDILRAEIAAGTLSGKSAKEYMEKGMLVPDDIVVVMVKERLLQPDVQENGWLLDGYPRSLSQAKALEDLGIRPDLFILLEVNENTLVKRVVGRRLDPVTGKTYNLEYSPPENEEIAARLVQRFDDTEEKVKLRLKTHHQNVESVLALYNDITVKVNGDLPKEEVFGEIDKLLSFILEMKSKANPGSMPAGTAHLIE